MKLRLKDFLSVQAKSKTKAGEGLAKGTYKFFTSSPIQSKFVDSWQYNAEALVFGTGGNASVHYVDDKFSTSTDCLVMTNRKPQEVNLKCVYYFLLGNLHLLAAGFKGCGLQHISKDFILDIGIDLPEKSIQDKIVTVCDLLAGMMSNQKKQLEMLDDLVKSQFIEVFGEYDLRNAQDAWERIGAVAEVVGGSTPKTGESEFWGGEHYWITPAEIADDDFIIHRTERTLTDLGVRSCSLKLLPRGTVLLSSRAPIGKVAIAGVEMYCNQGFKNLICGERLNPFYAYYLLKFNTEYLNSLGRGATFKEISKKIVDDIAIPVPSLERQNEFAGFVEQIDKSKDVNELGVAA